MKRNYTNRERWDEWPYGMWTCRHSEAGIFRRVLFNRGYEPIWEMRAPDWRGVKASRGEWIEDIACTEYFYSDYSCDRITRTNAAEIVAMFITGMAFDVGLWRESINRQKRQNCIWATGTSWDRDSPLSFYPKWEYALAQAIRAHEVAA